MLRLASLLLILSFGPARAGDYHFKARVYVVPRASYEKGIPPDATRRVAAEGRTDLAKSVSLEDLRKKDIVSSADLQVDEKGVKGEPVTSTLQWGLQASVKPETVFGDGTVLVDIAIKLTIPFASKFVTEFGTKIEMPRLCELDATTKAKIPLGSTVVIGSVVPGAPEEMLVVVIEVNSGKKVEELLKDQVERPVPPTTWLASTVVSFKAIAQAPKEFPALRAAAEFVSFAPATEGSPLRVTVTWKETYVTERVVDKSMGRAILMPGWTEAVAATSWTATAAKGGFNFQTDVEWLKGYRAAARKKDVRDAVEPVIVMGTGADFVELDKSVLAGMSHEQKDVPMCALFSITR